MKGRVAKSRTNNTQNNKINNKKKLYRYRTGNGEKWKKKKKTNKNENKIIRCSWFPPIFGVRPVCTISILERPPHTVRPTYLRAGVWNCKKCRSLRSAILLLLLLCCSGMLAFPIYCTNYSLALFCAIQMVPGNSCPQRRCWICFGFCFV